MAIFNDGWSMDCDGDKPGCLESLSDFTKKRLLRTARERGWKQRRGKWLCPDCQNWEADHAANE